MARLAPRRLGALALALALLGGSGGPATAATYPASLASTGDSITMAFNTGLFPYVDNPAGSWSTGTTTSVNSLYRRILAANPAISGRNWNHARSGAKMADLAGQLGAAATRAPGAVTVLMGGNDACASSEAAMTSVADFETRFRAGLAAVTSGSPGTRILVASVPNVYQLWSLFRNNSTARSVWATFAICQSMLVRPTSTLQADVDRRARVLQRVRDYNAVLARVCAEVVTCSFDGNAVFNTAFTTKDVTTRDYFHPSATGQAKLAATLFPVWFP